MRALFPGLRRLRFFPGVVLAIGALLLAFTGRLPAVAAALPDKAEVPAGWEKFGPEVVVLMKEVVARGRGLVETIWKEAMRTHLAEATRVAGLSAAQLKTLEGSTGEAIAQALDAWTTDVARHWSQWVPETREEAITGLSESMAGMEAMSADLASLGAPPFSQPKWRAALERVLSAEQLARWQAVEKERRAAVEKDLEGMLQPQLLARRESLRQAFDGHLRPLLALLPRSAEKRPQLETLAKRLTDEQLAKWEERTRRILLQTTPEQRARFGKGELDALGLAAFDLPELKRIWDAAVGQVLSVEVLQRLAQTREGQQTRLSQALAQVAVALLDEAVAFTTPQRERLQTLAAPLLQAESALSKELAPGEYSQLPMQQLFQTVDKIGEATLATLLDPLQLARWKDACSGKSSPTRLRNRMIAVQNAAPVQGAAATPRTADPEEIENALSDSLYDRTAEERRRLLAVNLLRAEDAARVSGISPELARQLAIAARGAVEAQLEPWKATTEETLRSQLRDVTVENIRQRLAAVENSSAMRSPRSVGKEKNLLESTCETVLTPAQREAWKAVVAARAEFRDRAIASLVLAQFARRHPLTVEQTAALEPLLFHAVKSHRPDIESMFNYGDSRWYLSSHTLFIPLAAVPEAELKVVVGPAVWAAWQKSPEFGNLSNYWEHVQRMHQNRVRVIRP